MWWPFLLLLYPRKWTLTDFIGHLCLLVNSPFLLLHIKKPCLSRTAQLKKKICFWVVTIHAFCIWIAGSDWNTASSLCCNSCSLWCTDTEHMLFVDYLAIDHSILCLKLIALLGLQGKISAVLKAVFFTLANLTWFSTERNLIAADFLLGMHGCCVCHCLESFLLCWVKDLIALWVTGLERAG